MISQPERYIDAFFRAGSDLLTFHIEAVENPRPVLQQIRQLGAGAGIALNPDTPLEKIEPYLDDCDLVLVMSVPAGFGGQPFHENALQKLEQLKQRAGANVMLEVDGGVNNDTIGRCVQAGAEYFVVGSAIFRQPDYKTAMQGLAANF